MIELQNAFKVQGIYTSIEPIWSENFKYKTDRHNFWELVYVVDGYAGILKDDKIYELFPGELIFHSPMEFHSIWAKNSQKLHLIVINFSAVDREIYPLNDKIFHPDQTVVSLLYEILNLSCYCSEFDDKIKNHLLLNSLERILLLLLSQTDVQYHSKKTSGDENYDIIIKAMTDNVDKKLTIQELAQICNLSSSNLKKVFRKHSGLGVIEYFNQLKVSEAMKLLNSDVSIAQISEQLGYSSPCYFCDCFKRHCGLTPSEYKRNFKSTVSYKK